MTKTTTKAAEAASTPKAAVINEEGRAFLKRGAVRTREGAERAKEAALEATAKAETAYTARANELAEVGRTLIGYAFEDAALASTAFEKLVEAKDLESAVRAQMDYVAARNQALVARAGRYAEFVTGQFNKNVAAYQAQVAQSAKAMTPAAA